MNEIVKTWLGYRILVIEALIHYNGKAHTASIDDYIIQKENVIDLDPKKVKRNISFAKVYLKKYGMVKGLPSNILQLETRFMEMDLDDTNEIIRKRHRILNLARSIAERAFYKRYKNASERYDFTFDGKPFFVEYSYSSQLVLDSNFDTDEVSQLLNNIESYLKKYEFDRLKRA